EKHRVESKEPCRVIGDLSAVWQAVPYELRVLVKIVQHGNNFPAKMIMYSNANTTGITRSTLPSCRKPDLTFAALLPGSSLSRAHSSVKGFTGRWSASIWLITVNFASFSLR